MKPSLHWIIEDEKKVKENAEKASTPTLTEGQNTRFCNKNALSSMKASCTGDNQGNGNKKALHSEINIMNILKLIVEEACNG